MLEFGVCAIQFKSIQLSIYAKRQGLIVTKGIASNVPPSINIHTDTTKYSETWNNHTIQQQTTSTKTKSIEQRKRFS